MEIVEQRCPECHKINDGTLHQCPCGYIFGDQAIKENMARLSNDELIKIVNIDFAAYRKEAIDIAKKELEKRKKEEVQKEEKRRELQIKREKERKELEEYEKLKAQKIQQLKEKKQYSENEEKKQSLKSEECCVINHYYQILELNPNASKEEIKQAYMEKIREIVEAYEKLILYLKKSSKQFSQSKKK